MEEEKVLNEISRKTIAELNERVSDKEVRSYKPRTLSLSSSHRLRLSLTLM